VEQANSPRRSPKPEVMKRSKSEDLGIYSVAKLAVETGHAMLINLYLK
jgi:hypothetical protein